MRQRLVLSVLAAGAAVLGTTSLAPAKPKPAAPPPTAAPASYVIPGGEVFPEGIAREPGTRAFYVTSTTDGTIFRGSLDQPALTAFAAPTADRTTAVGLKADRFGTLVVAGGATGKVFVLSTDGSREEEVFDTKPAGPSFLNDVAISGGYAYITDSQQPFLYRLRLGPDGPIGEIERFVGFAGTAFAYGAGFNANGIAIDERGRYAIVVKSSTGELFRVDLRTRAVSEVDLGGATVLAGDGLLLRRDVLYVARNAAELIVPVRLRANGKRGIVGAGVTGPQLKYPTTIALDGDRILAVNSQFDKRGPGLTPELPFDVATIAAPAAPKGGR